MEGMGNILIVKTSKSLSWHCLWLWFQISRQSIDAVKNYFREEMSKTDWQLIMELKKTFEIL